MQPATLKCAYTAPTGPAAGRHASTRSPAAPGPLPRPKKGRPGLRSPSAGAGVTVFAVAGALIWANAQPAGYEAFWATRLELGLGSTRLGWSLHTWVDSGLMTLFFLVVGLEARKEFDLGDLRERSRLVLPVTASLIAMAVPVGIYLAVNHGGPAAHGWGVAMSTDSALALGAFAMVARGVPDQVRAFLLALFVVDDVAALLLVIFAYGDAIRPAPALLALGSFSALLFARKWAPAASRRTDLLFGAGTWAALMFSGIEPPVAGLLIGLATTARAPQRTDLEHATGLVRLFREQPDAARARAATVGLSASLSANARLQHLFHPWTTFVIVPAFALANAGIPLSAQVLAQAATSPVTIGIVAAYVLGKPAAVIAGSWAIARSSRGRLSSPVGWGAVLGSGTLAGVGFTVSLLIATLAFTGAHLEQAKVGVLTAATLSTVTSWAVYRIIDLLPATRRHRALLGDGARPNDLGDEVDTDRDHVRGAKDAPITVVEYGDFECPYCSRTEPATRELLTQHPDVRYVWRHLPLGDIHPHARLAAEAAEAAAAQGAFWAMHTRLLEKQDHLDLGDLMAHAEELGLDTARFRGELLSGTHRPVVDRHIASADANGVTGTPTFFINGRLYTGSHDAAALAGAIETAREELGLASPAVHASGSTGGSRLARVVLHAPARRPGEPAGTPAHGRCGRRDKSAA